MSSSWMTLIAAIALPCMPPLNSCIHFAALAYVGESVAKPAVYFENNVAKFGTHELSIISKLLSSLGLGPGKFYKRRSQEKRLLRWLELFFLLSPLDGAGSVLTARARCSVAGHCRPAIRGFLPAVFIASSQRSLSVPKPAKQNGGQVGDHSSTRDSWPIAFSGYPRGPRVACETRCPKHAAPNLPAETRSRTRVSREPDGHRQRRSPGWSGLNQRHSSCLWFQILGVEAHSSLFHTINTMVAIFLAKVSRAIFRPHALSQQFRIELCEGTGFARRDDRRSLKRFFRS